VNPVPERHTGLKYLRTNMTSNILGNLFYLIHHIIFTLQRTALDDNVVVGECKPKIERLAELKLVLGKDSHIRVRLDIN
jgi:hypothetical protein